MIVEQDGRGTVLRGLGHLQGRPVALFATHQHRLAPHVSGARVVRFVAIARVDQHGPQPRARGLVAARKRHSVTPPADRTGCVQCDRLERLAIDGEAGHRIPIRAHREGFDARRKAELAEAPRDDLGERGFLRAAGHHRAFAHALRDAVAARRNEPHVGEHTPGVERIEHALLFRGDDGRCRRGLAGKRECRDDQRGQENGSSHRQEGAAPTRARTGSRRTTSPRRRCRRSSGRSIPPGNTRPAHVRPGRGQGRSARPADSAAGR
jgi:hypothetical protein